MGLVKIYEKIKMRLIIALDKLTMANIGSIIEYMWVVYLPYCNTHSSRMTARWNDKAWERESLIESVCVLARERKNDSR